VEVAANFERMSPSCFEPTNRSANRLVVQAGSRRDPLHRGRPPARFALEEQRLVDASLAIDQMRSNLDDVLGVELDVRSHGPTAGAARRGLARRHHCTPWMGRIGDRNR